MGSLFKKPKSTAQTQTGGPSAAELQQQIDALNAERDRIPEPKPVLAIPDLESAGAKKRRREEALRLTERSSRTTTRLTRPSLLS